MESARDDQGKVPEWRGSGFAPCKSSEVLLRLSLAPREVLLERCALLHLCLQSPRSYARLWRDLQTGDLKSDSDGTSSAVDLSRLATLDFLPMFVDTLGSDAFAYAAWRRAASAEYKIPSFCASAAVSPWEADEVVCFCLRVSLLHATSGAVQSGDESAPQQEVHLKKLVESLLSAPSCMQGDTRTRSAAELPFPPFLHCFAESKEGLKDSAACTTPGISSLAAFFFASKTAQTSEMTERGSPETSVHLRRNVEAVRDALKEASWKSAVQKVALHATAEARRCEAGGKVSPTLSESSWHGEDPREVSDDVLDLVGDVGYRLALRMTAATNDVSLLLKRTAFCFGGTDAPGRPYAFTSRRVSEAVTSLVEELVNYDPPSMILGGENGSGLFAGGEGIALLRAPGSGLAVAVRAAVKTVLPASLLTATLSISAEGRERGGEGGNGERGGADSEFLPVTLVRVFPVSLHQPVGENISRAFRRTVAFASAWARGKTRRVFVLQRLLDLRRTQTARRSDGEFAADDAQETQKQTAVSAANCSDANNGGSVQLEHATSPRGVAASPPSNQEGDDVWRLVGMVDEDETCFKKAAHVAEALISQLFVFARPKKFLWGLSLFVGLRWRTEFCCFEFFVAVREPSKMRLILHEAVQPCVLDEVSTQLAFSSVLSRLIPFLALRDESTLAMLISPDTQKLLLAAAETNAGSLEGDAQLSLEMEEEPLLQRRCREATSKKTPVVASIDANQSLHRLALLNATLDLPRTHLSASILRRGDCFVRSPSGSEVRPDQVEAKGGDMQRVDSSLLGVYLSQVQKESSSLFFKQGLSPEQSRLRRAVAVALSLGEDKCSTERRVVAPLQNRVSTGEEDVSFCKTSCCCTAGIKSNAPRDGLLSEVKWRPCSFSFVASGASADSGDFCKGVCSEYFGVGETIGQSLREAIILALLFPNQRLLLQQRLRSRRVSLGEDGSIEQGLQNESRNLALSKSLSGNSGSEVSSSEVTVDEVSSSVPGCKETGASTSDSSSSRWEEMWRFLKETATAVKSARAGHGEGASPPPSRDSDKLPCREEVVSPKSGLGLAAPRAEAETQSFVSEAIALSSVTFQRGTSSDAETKTPPTREISVLAGETGEGDSSPHFLLKAKSLLSSSSVLASSAASAASSPSTCAKARKPNPILMSGDASPAEEESSELEEGLSNLARDPEDISKQSESGLSFALQRLVAAVSGEGGGKGDFNEASASSVNSLASLQQVAAPLQVAFTDARQCCAVQTESAEVPFQLSASSTTPGRGDRSGLPLDERSSCSASLTGAVSGVGAEKNGELGSDAQFQYAASGGAPVPTSAFSSSSSNSQVSSGVYYDGNRLTWRCQWREKGKLRSKGFAIRKYGDSERAWRACVSHRARMLEKAAEAAETEMRKKILSSLESNLGGWCSDWSSGETTGGAAVGSQKASSSLSPPEGEVEALIRQVRSLHKQGLARAQQEAAVSSLNSKDPKVTSDLDGRDAQVATSLGSRQLFRRQPQRVRRLKEKDQQQERAPQHQQLQPTRRQSGEEGDRRDDLIPVVRSVKQLLLQRQLRLAASPEPASLDVGLSKMLHALASTEQRAPQVCERSLSLSNATMNQLEALGQHRMADSSRPSLPTHDGFREPLLKDDDASLLDEKVLLQTRVEGSAGGRGTASEEGNWRRREGGGRPFEEETTTLFSEDPSGLNGETARSDLGSAVWTAVRQKRLCPPASPTFTQEQASPSDSQFAKRQRNSHGVSECCMGDIQRRLQILKATLTHLQTQRRSNPSPSPTDNAARNWKEQ